MKLFLYLSGLIFILTNCSGSSPKKLVDIIIVNAKGDEIYVNDEVFKDRDSVRVEISELTRISVLTQGFDAFGATIFPNSSIHRRSQGIEKIYITLLTDNISIERKKDQRYIELEDATVSLSTEDSYTFESEDEFDDNKENFRGFSANPSFNERFDSFKYLQVKKALTDFRVSDYLGRHFVLNNFDNDSVFGAADDLSFKLIINKWRFMAVEGEKGEFSVQLSGEWRLMNSYDEVIYNHPLRTYNSITGFIPESIHGDFNFGFFRSGGVTRAIEEAIRASFYDFFNSKKTQFYLNKRNPLFKETQKTNQKLPVVQLKTQRNNSKVSLEENLESTVLISDKNGFGSGSIISEDGYILTNYHVINDMEKINITLNSGKKVEATLVRCDKILDVALLKIECNSCKPIRFNTNYHVGDDVFDIGTPLDTEHFNSVFSGIISAVRMVHAKPYIQTNSVSSSGMSGGPLVNVNGEQIGIRVWGLVDRKGDDIYGLCYYIPVSEAFKSLNIKR